MPSSWSQPDWRELGEGRYRGVLRALPAGVNADADVEASGTALAYHLRVGAGDWATQTIRVTHCQPVTVEVEVDRYQAHSARWSPNQATVRFCSATDIPTVGRLVLSPERVEIAGEVAGQHFVLRSPPFLGTESRERAIWQSALRKGRLPQQRLEGWAHALHSATAVPYAVDIGIAGDAVEEITVPYVEEQPVDVRVYPPPLFSRFDRRSTAGSTLVAVRLRDPSGWPEGWGHCVGHVDVDGVWCKLVVWGGNDPETVPRWLPSTSTAAERELELSGNSALIHIGSSRGEFSIGSGSRIGESSFAMHRRRRLLPGSAGAIRQSPRRAERVRTVSQDVDSLSSSASSANFVEVDCCAADGAALSPNRRRTALHVLPASSANASARLSTARARRSPVRRRGGTSAGSSSDRSSSVQSRSPQRSVRANLCMSDLGNDAGPSPFLEPARETMVISPRVRSRSRSRSRSRERRSQSTQQGSSNITSSHRPSTLEPVSGRRIGTRVDGMADWNTPRWRVEQRRQRRQQRQKRDTSSGISKITAACSGLSSEESDSEDETGVSTSSGSSSETAARRTARRTAAELDSDSDSEDSDDISALTAGNPGCFACLTRPLVDSRGRRVTSWEAAMGVNRHGQFHHALRVVSAVWRGGVGSATDSQRRRRRNSSAPRPMTGVDAACAVGILGVGALCTLHVLRRVLERKN